MAPNTSSPDARLAAEQPLRKTDVSEGDTLYDRVYDIEVAVVGVHVGAVYLRYPHQEKKHTYEHACGAGLLGYDNLREHAEECDEANDEFWNSTDPGRLTEISENGEVDYEKVEVEGRHIEAFSYQWPLDGNRFEVQ